MTASAAALLAVAKGQVGYVEQGGPHGNDGNLTKFGKAYGLNGYAWCSVFVWWVFLQLGIDVRQKISRNYAGAEQAMEGFAAHGWKISGSSHTPRPGDVVFFHFNGEHSGANHTGLVIDHDEHGCHTVEGNTSRGTSGSQVNGGGVYLRYRPWSTIIGYGRYPFPANQHTVQPAAKSADKTYPTLQYPMGSGGHPSSAVHNMQRLLHLNPDGVYTLKVKAVVKSFQAKHGLNPDGIAGPATLRALGY